MNGKRLQQDNDVHAKDEKVVKKGFLVNSKDALYPEGMHARTCICHANLQRTLVVHAV